LQFKQAIGGDPVGSLSQGYAALALNAQQFKWAWSGEQTSVCLIDHDQQISISFAELEKLKSDQGKLLQFFEKLLLEGIYEFAEGRMDGLIGLMEQIRGGEQNVLEEERRLLVALWELGCISLLCVQESSLPQILKWITISLERIKATQSREMGEWLCFCTEAELILRFGQAKISGLRGQLGIEHTEADQTTLTSFSEKLNFL
jgi:hypothetical protein